MMSTASSPPSNAMRSLSTIARSALICAAMLGLAGCITVGRVFPTEAVPSIAIGTATQADIQRAYGAPFRTGVEDGDVTWTYLNYRLRLFGQPCTQDLVVRFGREGTVKSYSFNTTTSGVC